MVTDYKKYFKLAPDVHYLNCASFSPNLYSVIEAGIQGIEIKSNPHLIKSEDFFSVPGITKDLLSKIINCSSEDIALFPAVSFGMATVAKNLALKKGLTEGQEILVVKEEFPSDVLAWKEICDSKKLTVKTVSPPDSADRGKVWNEMILEAISPKTCMIVLPNIHWTDGTVFNLKAIRKRTLEAGAWMIVDGSQSVGALYFDVAEINPDALISVGYKCLYGPYGLGFGYFGEAFKNGMPIEFSWVNRINSHDFENLVNYQHTYREGAFRYNMGEQSNFILIPMLNAGLKQLISWGGAAVVQEHCKNITGNAIAELQQMGFIIEEENYRANHLFGIRVPENISIEKIRKAFDAGKISISIRANSIRCSNNLFNTVEDMQALVTSLKSVL
jgi:selenocysteine lyase/cysteine desulfurase